MLKAVRFLAGLCFSALLLRPGGAAAQAPQPDGGQYRDMRIYIDFTDATSGYHDNPGGQDKMRRAMALGFRMWQSVLPGIGFQWVGSPGEANFTITFANYNDASVPRPVCYQPGFTACALSTGIWVNDGGGMPFTFEEGDYTTRDEIYQGYIPATYPPHNYRFPYTIGDIAGYWPFATYNDMSVILMHEFAHSLGMFHIAPDLATMENWFGTTTKITPNLSQYPGLPSSYYGCGTQSSPCASKLNPLSSVALNRMFGQENLPGGKLPDGMAHPPWTAYNNRAFYDLDFTAPGLGGYKFKRTNTSGLVVMYRPNTGERFVTGNWVDALAKTQLTSATQTSPYFVTDVHPNVKSRSKLACGTSHTLAIRNDGSLWAWGANNVGQLGNGTTTQSLKPVKIGTSTSWAAVAAGDDFSVALKTDGTLWAWGNNAYGNLGIGSTGGTRTSPTQACATSGQPCYGNKYVGLSAGAGHVLALRDNGTIWAFGLNGDGQLGDGSNTNRAYPTLSAWGDNQWVEIAAGGYHSLALSAWGSVWGWGYGAQGQLGNGTTSSSSYPWQEATYSWDWAEIVAGTTYSLARKTDGTLHSWGSNGNGQLGNGSTGGINAYPSHVAGDGWSTDWADIAAGQWHAGGVKNRGEALTWGWNGLGQLGDNTTTDRNLPGSEVYLAGPEWSSIAMGHSHTVARKSDGTFWAWGNNGSGQLGVNSTTTRFLKPTKTLFTDAPTVAITAPTTAFNFNKDPITLAASAGPAGAIAKVEFFDGGTKLGEDATAPYTYAWNNAPRGLHSVTAKATDLLGVTVTSAVATVPVYHFTNWTYATAAYGTVINLTGTGTVDWLHLGLNGTEANLKNVSNLILTPVVMGPGLTAQHYVGGSSNNFGFTWTDGKTGTGLTPSRTTATYNGIKPSAIQTGSIFDVWVTAPLANRKLNLYVRAANVNVTMEAVLAGASTPVTAVWNTANGSANGLRVYSISFGAPVTGYFLRATIKVGSVGANPSLQLMGATVQ